VTLVADNEPPKILEPGKESLDLPPPSVATQRAVESLGEDLENAPQHTRAHPLLKPPVARLIGGNYYLQRTAISSI